MGLRAISFIWVVDYGPPLFIMGFMGSAESKLENMQEMSEGMINVIGEGMAEAMNFRSVDTPIGVSEWFDKGREQEGENAKGKWESVLCRGWIGCGLEF